MKNPSRESVRRYCIANELFTSGTNAQYEAMFGMCDRQMPIHDIATVIWICSCTDKHADEIENDLRAMMIPDEAERSGEYADESGLSPAT